MKSEVSRYKFIFKSFDLKVARAVFEGAEGDGDVVFWEDIFDGVGPFEDDDGGGVCE